MGAVIDAIHAARADVLGMVQVRNVVADVVAGASMGILRTFEHARFLLARLIGRPEARQLTLAKCRLPVASGMTWAPSTASSGTRHPRGYRRLSRPGSAPRPTGT